MTREERIALVEGWIKDSLAALERIRQGKQSKDTLDVADSRDLYLIQGLLLWRGGRSPLKAFRDYLGALLERGMGELCVMGFETAAIIESLFGERELHDRLVREGDWKHVPGGAQRQPEWLLAQLLHGEYDPEKWDKALAHKQAKPIRETYDTYRQLVLAGRAQDQERVTALIETAIRRYDGRARSGFWMNGAWCDGGGDWNQDVVDFRLAAILKVCNIPAPADCIHAWGSWERLPASAEKAPEPPRKAAASTAPLLAMREMIAGHLLFAAPDVDQLRQLDPRIGWTVYRHAKGPVWALDTYKATKSGHYPFALLMNSLNMAEDRKALPPNLAAVVRILAENEGRDDAYQQMFIGRRVSELLGARVFSFASDDDDAQLTCLSESGQVVQFHQRDGVFDIVFKKGALTIRPEVSDEDPEEPDEELLAELAAVPNVKIGQPRKVGDVMLHEILTDDWPSKETDPSDLEGTETPVEFQYLTKVAER